jgi:CCR4-NOT transcription complex subunit 4
MRLQTTTTIQEMSTNDEQKECPLCMENFDLDEYSFYPCVCRYQICRFCWHRLRTDENGLCPACRQPYPDDPVTFQPVSAADLPKLKPEKKKKAKTTVSDCRKHLSAYRVLTKNLVYVVGLPQRVADGDTLKKSEFFGRFGKILRVAVGTSPATGNQPPSYTAYVTYDKDNDALRAIQAVNNLVIDGRMLKASLGTTKYCVKFLGGQPCHKQECMFLHEVAEDELSFTKDDMHQGKHAEYERKLHEQMLLDDQKRKEHAARLKAAAAAKANEMKAMATQQPTTASTNVPTTAANVPTTALANVPLSKSAAEAKKNGSHQEIR